MHRRMLMSGSLLLLMFSIQLVQPVVFQKIEINNETIDLITPPQFKINSDIPINIVFIGFDESNIDTNQIDQGLTHWYAPLINQWDYPYMGMNYTFSVNYYMSNSTSLEADYTNYLASIGTTNSTPIDSLTRYDPTANTALLFNASDAIAWLDNNINSYFAGLNNSYTLYFIDTYTFGYILDYYYYTLDYIDPDTGLPSLNPYTIIYGGEWDNRGILMDLSAGPVDYYETEITEANEGVSATTIPPIWAYTFPTDKVKFNDNITEYIQETIDMVYTPSYLYDPEIREDFEVAIYLFDDATVSQADQIDIQVIYDSFAFLYPTMNVTISLTVDTLSNFPELETLMANSISTTNANVIESRPVVDYLLANLANFGMNDNTLPVFLWAWDTNLWLTGEGILGVGMDDGFGNPGMVAMGYNPTMGNSNEGYTVTLIHEIGHLVGFRHPHDGFSFDSFFDTGYGNIVDWLRDFISTPMTYAQVDTSFSTFDVDNMDRAFTYERINDTWWDLYDANQTLVAKDYDSFSDINQSSIENYLSWSLSNISLALEEFEYEYFFDAFTYANLSYVAAELYLDMANSLGVYVTPTPTSDTSPTNTTSTTNTTTSTSDTSPTSPGTTVITPPPSSISSEEPTPLGVISILLGLMLVPIIIRIKLKLSNI